MGNCAEAVGVAKLLRLIGDANFLFVKRGDYRPGDIVKKLRELSKIQIDLRTHGDVDVKATGLPRPTTPSIHHPTGFVGL